MLFNSFEFIFLYIPVVVCIFFLLGRRNEKRYATGWLVAASLFFYGWWDVRYVPLLCGSICINYWIGRQIEQGNDKSKNWLWLGIAINIALLGYYKYTDFFLASANDIMGAGYFHLQHIVLPLGISFFTFTQTAYLIDAYRGETSNKSFLTYCEFVTIFPHLIAGPIISHSKMIPQFLADSTFRPNYHNIAMGIGIFSMGLCKKTVIADNLSRTVTQVFSDIGHMGMVESWIGALAYTFQLYFDFSGYSEMAIGLGLMLNLQLPQNFNSPYKAASIIDFWRRWHMTLGTWVKDYLYIPLGGNRQGELCKLRNLFVSMAAIGLWHGAGWTFVAWGALHGLFLVINHSWRRLKIKLPWLLSWGMTFLCVIICWVFFRADSIHDALALLANMTDFGRLYLPLGGKWVQYLGWTGIEFGRWQLDVTLAECMAALLILMVCLLTLKNPVEIYPDIKPNKKWLLLISLLFLAGIYAIGTVGTGEFLYFQF